MHGVEEAGLPPAHAIVAVAVVAVWGTNFVVVHEALQRFPPLTLGALRFALSAAPLVFVIRRPPGRLRELALYGGLLALQYGLLYLGLRKDISPGLASVVLQTQVFFSIAFACLLGRERVHRSQGFALIMAASGLALIAVRADGSATPLGLALVIGAALSWGVANALVRIGTAVNAFGFIVWASLFAFPPLLVLALLFEGPHAIDHAVRTADVAGWMALAWQAFANNILGFGVWAWLLARNTAANVTAVALLVPVFGLGASALLLNEPLEAWKLAATALVVGGLAVNLLWSTFRARHWSRPADRAICPEETAEMMFDEAHRFARRWVHAWNDRDLDAVLAHYAPDIRFRSPLAAQYSAAGEVHGLPDLRAYWTRGLAAHPRLRFELIEVLVGAASLTILYRNEIRQTVAETLVFDDAGKISDAYACYGAAQGAPELAVWDGRSLNETSPSLALTALDVAPRATASSYPSPFAERMAGRSKRVLGALFGLKNFGVNLTVLEPGSLSALLHRHSVQDEFVYVLEGHPTLVTDQGEVDLSPGMCAGFAAKGPAHQLVNRSKMPVVYLEIGDRSAGDTAQYPVDDLVAIAASGGWKFTHKDGTPYG